MKDPSKGILDVDKVNNLGICILNANKDGQVDHPGIGRQPDRNRGVKNLSIDKKQDKQATASNAVYAFLFSLHKVFFMTFSSELETIGSFSTLFIFDSLYTPPLP